MNKPTTYWKAILYDWPEGIFEVTTTDDKDAESYTSSVYSFCNGTAATGYTSGLFAIRDTKEAAIEAIRDYYKDKIVKVKDSIKLMEVKLKLIE